MAGDMFVGIYKKRRELRFATLFAEIALCDALKPDIQDKFRLSEYQTRFTRKVKEKK